MKTILVAISGTNSDETVLDAAYAIAQPLNAHLDFVHIPLSSIDPSDYNRHIEFTRGEALDVALKDALLNSNVAVTKAREHVTNYCTTRNILRTSSPSHRDRVTACWMENPPGVDGLMRAARTHDLTVMGRSAGQRAWSQNLLETLATTSGRPVLIVPHNSEKLTLSTIAVWWKDHGAAARALTAALPILQAASKVAIISILENDNQAADTATDLGIQLGWHGIEAAVEVLGRDHRPTINMLWTASLAKKANLVVMGGFSRSRIQEMIFGGCTRAILEDSVRPVFLLH